MQEFLREQVNKAKLGTWIPIDEADIRRVIHQNNVRFIETDGPVYLGVTRDTNLPDEGYMKTETIVFRICSTPCGPEFHKSLDTEERYSYYD